MAALARPPGLPSVLEGILNLSGAAIPVFRLDRLFELPEQRVTLYSMLVIVQDGARDRFAILVDEVSHILPADSAILLPLDREVTWNGCAPATLRVKDTIVYVLSPVRILQEKEKHVLREFQAVSQRRLEAWEPEHA